MQNNDSTKNIEAREPILQTRIEDSAEQHGSAVPEATHQLNTPALNPYAIIF
jgi:hypothetical protein